MMNASVERRGKSVERNARASEVGYFPHPSSLTARRYQQGFTLLIAVLMGSVLLAIGSAIYNILSKEVLFSASGRESQFAFYAADAGIECALYWDFKQDAFAQDAAQAEVTCNATAVPLTRTFDALTGIYTSTFEFSLGAVASDPCVAVEVRRTFNPTRTTIESSGRNTCVTENPRRTERAIRISY